MLRKISNGTAKVIQKCLPDAFIFCIILTIIVFIASLIATGAGIVGVTAYWGNGAWDLLSFSMQMILILVLGTALAEAPIVKRFLKWIAGKPKTAPGAIVLTTIISALAMWFNWGFGLVVGVLLAKEIARVQQRIDYRVLIASAYSVIVIWHPGFSGSIPLQIATVTETLTTQTGGVLAEATDAIPITQTIFAPWNLITIVIIIAALCLFNAKMHPKDADVVVCDPAKLVEEEVVLEKADSPAKKLEQSIILSMITGILILGYLVYYFATSGFSIDLNVCNMICLCLGIFLHKRPINYVRAINNAVKGAGALVLQFPFYAGIMGIMTGAPEGARSLAQYISDFFVNISTAHTFPVWTYISAGIVNFFVPSGGGQWTVQGPIVLPAAKTLGADYGLSCMAIAYGDAWTNLLQPFWALPALGIAGLGARDIMGYCVIDMVIVGIITIIAFLIVGSIF